MNKKTKLKNLSMSRKWLKMPSTKNIKTERLKLLKLEVNSIHL